MSTDKQLAPMDGEANAYESSVQLAMYLSLHYPSSAKQGQPHADTHLGADPILPHLHAPNHALRFPQRTAQILCSLKPRKMARALDIGCAVGGAAFELATKFSEVHAFDSSNSFISAAKTMQERGSMRYPLRIEGDISTTVVAKHEEATAPKKLRSRVNFFVGDACQLKEDLKSNGLFGDEETSRFDAVLLSNLLCRLPDPLACLNNLGDVVCDGGVVLILTPYTWLEDFTPRSKWIGGQTDDEGAPIRSRDCLKAIMENLGFQMIHLEQVPLIIREHQRKYQYIVSEATGWRKMA